MHNLILFGTLGCHLCEEANILLAGFSHVVIEHIDIAEQTQWQAQYAIKIPVLYHPHTKKELAWPFSQQQIQHFIDELD